MDYRTETMKEEWNRKPYQTPVKKSDEEIAKEWMIKEFGFYMVKLHVTPQSAKEILENMGMNRRLKQTGLLQYSSAMEKGRWVLSPQGLIFDENGKLLDGQHRLEGVVRSGKDMTFAAFFNVPHDTPIDIGIKRSSSDSLKIRGELSPELSLKDNISMVNSIFHAALSSSLFKAISDDDRAAFINKYAKEIDIARLASYKGGQDLFAIKSGVRGGLLAAAICGVGEETLNEFAEIVNTGCYGKDRPKNSALVLRRFISQAKSGKHGGVYISALQSFTEQALLDFENRKCRSQIYQDINYPYSEKIPVLEVIS